MGRIGLALVVLVASSAIASASDRSGCEAPLRESKFVGDDLSIPTSVVLDPDPHPGDKTPPEAPMNVTVTEADGREISVQGTFAPDTAYIRVVFDGYFFITTRDRTFVCIDHEVKAGERARVVAFDASQNQSPPFDTFVEMSDFPHHHDRHGMDALITVGAIMLAVLELVGLVVIGFIRKRTPASVAGEFLSPILAENVARAVARGYLIKLTVAIAIFMGLLALHHLDMTILVSPFAVVWLVEVLTSRHVVGQFDKKIQRLEKRENWIYINSTKLYAPRRAWAKASALPSAAVLD